MNELVGSTETAGLRYRMAEGPGLREIEILLWTPPAHQQHALLVNIYVIWHWAIIFN